MKITEKFKKLESDKRKLIENHAKNLSLKVGDYVKVVEKFDPREEMGLENIAWYSEMTPSIGKIHRVIEIDNKDNSVLLGEDVNNYWWFHILCLEKAEPITIKTNENDYQVIFHKNGDITVGCTKVSFSKLEAIYKKALEKIGYELIEVK